MIGSKFEKIIIPIDKRLTYENDKLVFVSTDEYPYLEQNGLYQAITRVKSELLFVIIDNIPFYEKIQSILT